uniref:Classical arabinogalactan protein 9-like n=1 Tax=Petromyzon marinus TaxID=7757 RepID=A0AAJ7XKN5_PETMA|nr:classical arabinogalactan protein 9-like [Petromyzon marinus]
MIGCGSTRPSTASAPRSPQPRASCVPRREIASAARPGSPPSGRSFPATANPPPDPIPPPILATEVPIPPPVVAIPPPPILATEVAIPPPPILATEVAMPPPPILATEVAIPPPPILATEVGNSTAAGGNPTTGVATSGGAGGGAPTTGGGGAGGGGGARWIALVQRGNCTFNTKVLVAQSLHASALLVVNSQELTVEVMALGGEWW